MECGCARLRAPRSHRIPDRRITLLPAGNGGELARPSEPSNQASIDVRRVADVFEIRDKGGVLGKINVRIFFCIDHDTRTIAILSVINKKNDGPTPKFDKIRATSRRRRYLEQHSGES